MAEVPAKSSPYAAHAETIAGLDLDVGLCPLIETEFNRQKSALKSYEYAAVGTLTVASDVTPYRDEVSLCVPNDRHAWSELLERLLRDRGRRQLELERQQEFVTRERNLATVVDRWEEVLRAVLDR